LFSFYLRKSGLIPISKIKDMVNFGYFQGRLNLAYITVSQAPCSHPNRDKKMYLFLN